MLRGLDEDLCTVPGAPLPHVQDIHAKHMPGISRALSQLGSQQWQLARGRRKITTYNATILKSVATQQCLEEGFAKSGISVIGIQKARCFGQSKVMSKSFVKFASVDVDGNLGCQLWLSTRKDLVGTCQSFGNHDEVKAGFAIEKAVICHATPRLLIVCAPLGYKLFAFVVGHALTSAATVPEIQQWWQNLDRELRKQLPRHALPILLLDANARVDASNADVRLQASNPVRENADQLVVLARKRDLDAGPLFGADGKRHVTWTSPSGTRSQTDYVLVPDSLQVAVKSAGMPSHFVYPLGFNHSPMPLDLYYQQQANVDQGPWASMPIACAQPRAKLFWNTSLLVPPW